MRRSTGGAECSAPPVVYMAIRFIIQRMTATRLKRTTGFPLWSISLLMTSPLSNVSALLTTNKKQGLNEAITEMERVRISLNAAWAYTDTPTIYGDRSLSDADFQELCELANRRALIAKRADHKGE